MGRVVELRAGAREPQVRDRLAFDGMGWVPEVNIARPHGVTHVHTDTIVRVVMGPWRSPDFVSGVSGWQIDADGSAEFNDVVVRGEIDANSGHIGTLDIDGVLTVGTGTPVIQIDGPNKRIRTSDFVSGQKGWEITHEGNAEFNNLFVRGELHATVFVADEMHATGGTLAVMTAAKVAEPDLSDDNKLPDFIDGGMTLVVQASWDTGLCYFAAHDVLRIKTMAEVAAGGSLDLWDIWLYVVSAPTSNGDRDLANGKPGTYDVFCTWRQGGEANLVIPTGAAVIHWGTIGTEEGGLILTSDLNYSPYIDIFTIPSATPWSSGTTPHVRVGNLDGILGLAEQWGMAAGKDLSDVAEPHIVMSDQQLGLWGVEQTWWDSAGNARGQIDPSAGSSDVLFWLGPSEAAAHFKVLGSGDVWLDTLAISGDLGDFLFSKVDGLLLLGPNCEINATEWWSLRRQKATISGAFHQEAGRWMGTRGLVIEEAETNHVVNPSFETNTTSWTLAGAARLSTRARFGGYSLKCDATPGNAEGRIDVTGLYQLTDYVVTCWAWLVSYAGAEPLLRKSTQGGWANLVQVEWDTSILNQWQRVVLPFTTVAGETAVRLSVGNFTGSSSLTAYVDGIQLEGGVLPCSYLDGSLGPGYTWSGTVHGSRSTRTATEVNLDAHTSLINSSTKFSIRTVFQVSHSAADWTGTPTIWMIYKDSSNYIHCYFHTTTNVWYVYGKFAGDVLALASSAQTFAAGDWVDLVVTCDFYNDNYYLYVDGVQEDYETPALTNPATFNQWNIGSYYDATNQADVTVAEYAVFGTPLGPGEVAAMYALQRPLVDAGPLEGPGVYILDGKFRMASSLTGNRIEIDADEIAGYDGGGTKQFCLRASDGAAYAGGTVVRLNADGFQIVASSAAGDPEKLRFLYDDSGTLRRQGSVFADWGGGGGDPNITWLQARRVAGDPWPVGVQVVLIAHDTVVGTDVRIAVNSSKVVDVTGEEIFKTEKLLRPGTGTSDPTAQLEDGCLFYRTDTDKLRLRANGAWVDLN